MFYNNILNDMSRGTITNVIDRQVNITLSSDKKHELTTVCDE